MAEKKPTAKVSKDTVYVDVEDEITSIIEKVEAADQPIVALVLPKRPAVLQSIVNLRLLKRSAEGADKKIVLISSEPTVLSLAGAVGVHVAKNLQSQPYIPTSPVPVSQPPEKVPAATDEATDIKAEKAATLDRHRSMGELAVSGEAEEPETISLSEDEAKTAQPPTKELKKDETETGPPKGKKLKIPNFDKFRSRLALTIIGVVGLVVLLLLMTKVLPKATITIKESATPISANFNLTTSDSAKAVDTAKNIVPAVVQSSDQTSTQQVAASGQQNNGNKASGSVTMSAGPCSGTVPNSVPAGTGISNSGLTYITQSTASFSPVISGSSCTFQSGSIGITAQAGGSNYNVAGGTTFKISGRSDVSGTGSASGGTDNIVTVVAQADIDKVKKSITSQSSDQFSKDFQKKIADQGYYLVQPTLKISEPATTASPDVGQPASNVTVTIKITYSVLAIKKDDLKQIASQQLKKQIDTSKQEILDSDLLAGITMSVQDQAAGANATLVVTANASATPQIDIEAIKKQAAGKKSGEIRSMVTAVNGVKDADVKLSPFWVSKAPGPGKVKIILQKVSDGSH